ncbi:PD-(D/E)XK nuclease family protein [Bacillus sp. AGMB 02131]|uniref:PD-(D/E)XK nuclease family protein n=1 Tax=Peribacillus faecalis TaxID=2772559 RepID=A0A927CZX2_9BACI|nr:PD-(D/E)XK nuclease family protein [Peribacillus faecalis]MBD3108449.1 PD-(D/E)XK nuclease family protein [Peribacillus faecalis]
MDYMINELKQICHMEPLREKILIADSYYIGNQIVEAYMEKERFVVNLHVKTVHELAVEILSSQKIFLGTIADKVITEYFIYETVMNLKKKSQLYYFNSIEITSSFCKSIHNTIMQLRLAGYDENNIDETNFLSSNKGNDFKKILAHYKQMLDSNQLVDSAEVLQQALQIVSENNKSLYILQPNLQLTNLELQFLQKLLPEKKYKLSLAKVYGVNLPENPSIETIKWGPPVPLSYIYCPNNYTKPIETIDVHIAKTVELEVKAVLQSLKQKKAPLDQSTIFYTSSEPYISAIYHLSQKLNIPVTFSEGLPILYSRPGKLAGGLLKWLQSDYHIHTFLPLLRDGLILFKGTAAPTNSQAIKLLKDLQIGWGKERYLSLFDKTINALEEQERDSEHKERVGKLESLRYMKNWFRNALESLSIDKGKISYKSLLTGIRSILSNQSAVITELDYAANKELMGKIEAILPYLKEETLAIYDAVQRASELLLAGRIFASDPKPGCLHAANYEDGIYNRRKFTYFVGLDNQSFPGKIMEDPLLLDNERARLRLQMPLLKEQAEKRLYTILQALAQCNGHITASYCNFDVTNNRILNPSYLFLQLYRAANGNSLADFKEINDVQTRIFSEKAIEEYDVWALQFAGGQSYSPQSGLFEAHPNVMNGLIAEQMRHTELFTDYDGKVNIEGTEASALYKHKTLSASKLEMLATCPYAYFLSEVLKLKPAESKEYDANRWLDAKTRGILLHKIFELFLKRLKEQCEKPNYVKHRTLMMELAQQIIDEEKQRVTPPNNSVFQAESADILYCCDIFLKEEEVFCEIYEPYEFEYTFGLNGIEPAVLSLDDEEYILVSGKSDRVDFDQSGKMHIIDYKTGSAYKFNERNVFNGGRQLQHFIYALAIEQHMGLEAGTVIESSYYFPSAKGFGERIVRKQTADARKSGTVILTDLINIIKQGDFMMTDDLEDCRYCDYKSVCRRASYDSVTYHKKLTDERYSGLASLKEVRGYD